MRSIPNIPYNDKGQLLDIHLPDDPVKAIFLFFHGGGLEGGSREYDNVFMGHLIKHHIAVVSADYRIYPKAAYPDFIEDAADAVAWTCENMHRYVACDKLFVGGSSAGAYLSMMLCFDDRYLDRHGIRPMDIAGYIHNAGQPTSHYNVLRERGLDPKRLIVDETAPLYYVGLRAAYAPMLFLVSDNDMQNRYEQTMLMLSTLQHFGYDAAKVEWKLMHGAHCQHDQAVDENGESVFGKIISAFIDKQLDPRLD